MLRRRSGLSLLLAGLLLSTLAAGGSAQSPAAGPGGTDWRLTQIAGSGVPFIDVPDSVEATLRIDGSQAGGRGGCNQWFSDVKIDGDAMVFGPIGSTMMACDEPSMSFERQYLAYLADVQRWAISDGQLQLADANGAVLLVFSSGALGTIEGIDWRASELLDGPTLAAIPAQVTVTLRLQDGETSGNAGCNGYFGSYALQGASLTFGAMASTKMACPEPQMEVESAWLTTLGLVTSWRMDGERLQILDGTDTVLAVLDPLTTNAVVGSWDVAEIADGSGAIVLLGETQANLTFGEDGSLTGSTGCNTISGSYVVDGTSVTFGPLATTEMACADASAQALDPAACGHGVRGVVVHQRRGVARAP